MILVEYVYGGSGDAWLEYFLLKSITINAERAKTIVSSKRTRLQLPALKFHGEEIE